jgi:hypothetical protein
MAAQVARTATYTNDPATVAIDFVRLEVGDTDCSVALVSDAEIRHFIAAENENLLRAASRAAKTMAAAVSRRHDFSHGPVSKSVSQAVAQLWELAAALERRAMIDTVLPVFTAQTKTDKQTFDLDDSLVEPNIEIGQTDNPRAGTQGPAGILDDQA